MEVLNACMVGIENSFNQVISDVYGLSIRLFEISFTFYSVNKKRTPIVNVKLMFDYFVFWPNS